jgi:polar amino acid transport system substrate-binding protein
MPRLDSKPSAASSILAAFKKATLVAIVVLLMPLYGSTIRLQSAGPTVSEVARSGKMLVGIDPSYPPFANIDAGTQEVVGFDVDLAKEIGRRLGVEVRFVYVDVGAIFDGLLVKRYDAIISGIPPYPELTRQVCYSHHYFNAGQVLIRRKDDSARQGISLHGQTVGVELGSAGEEEALRQAKADRSVTVRSFDTLDGALEALLQHELSIVVTDFLSAVERVKPEPRLVINPEFLTFEPYVVAVRKKDVLLLGEINNALQALEQDGFLDQLQHKWIE